MVPVVSDLLGWAGETPGIGGSCGLECQALIKSLSFYLRLTLRADRTGDFRYVHYKMFSLFFSCYQVVIKHLSHCVTNFARWSAISVCGDGRRRSLVTRPLVRGPHQSYAEGSCPRVTFKPELTFQSKAPNDKAKRLGLSQESAEVPI